MCTNKEINSVYNAFRGVHGTAGDMNVLTSLVHFFLLDASYDNFRKNVKTLPLKHENKRIVKKMQETYDAFFIRFFAPFSLDQRIYLGDKSDALREYIANDVELARLAMMDCHNQETSDTQKKLADIWICNRFASEAQEFYERTWKRKGFKFHGVIYTQPEIDKDIDGIVKYTRELAEYLFRDVKDITENHRRRFQSCVDALTRKICDWINNDYKQEIENGRKTETA